MESSTSDEDLLCWLGTREEGLSEEDAERIRSVAEEFAAGFSALPHRPGNHDLRLSADAPGRS